MKMDLCSNGLQKPDEYVIRAARRSLDDLRIERVGMIKRHAPMAAILAPDERIKAVEKIVREGNAWNSSGT